MQVHGPGADLDTICIGPSYVNREVDWNANIFVLWSIKIIFFCIWFFMFSLSGGFFFYTLHDILANMEEVSELQPIPDVHIPLMKFKFDGISIDLLYASISRLIVPEVRQIILFCTNFSNWSKCFYFQIQYFIIWFLSYFGILFFFFLINQQELDISDVSLLHNVDEPTVRSLNGCRVACS